MKKRLVSEVLFWTHFSIILFAVFAGLILPLWGVVLLAALHRVHTWIFNGCVFSKLERKWGGLDQQSDFLIHLVRRLFKYQLTAVGSKKLDYALLAASLSVAVSNFLVSHGVLSWMHLAIFVSALLGLAVSVALTRQYKKPRPSVCYVGGKCNLVLESRYAQVGGIKLSVLGVLFYAFCLIIFTASFWAPSVDYLLLGLSIVGGSVSISLVALQAVVIRAFCRYCLVSASSTVVLLVSSFSLSL